MRGAAQLARGRRSRAQLARWATALLVLLAIVLPLPGVPSSPVHAQSRPRAVTTAPRTAEVDAPFVIELRVTSDEGPLRAASPSLTPPIGLVVGHPSVSFFTNSTTINGMRRDQSEYRARWTIRAREPGRYAFEAPSVTIRGDRVRGNPVTVEVVPAGQGGPSSSPGAAPGAGPSPNMRFQFTWPFGSSAADDDPVLTDEPVGDLSLPHAPPGKDTIFLRAVADKTEAYVGEQITLSFYLYFRVSEVEWTDKTEAPLRDFLRIPLMRDPGTSGTSPALVGGRRWTVKLLDRAAVFPLRAGSLSTGKMAARFRGRRIGAKVMEESDEITIVAIEPPEAGRPPGYLVGDVGKFEVESDLRPRDARVGDMVTATIKVKGDGNPPTTIRLPASKGIEWLDPDRSFEQVVRGGRIGGVRTFKVLGKVLRGGYLELGNVEIPYWDPQAKAYAVAKADLGGVRAEGTSPAPTATGSAAPPASEDKDALASLPSPRATLRPFSRAPDASVPLLPFLGVVIAPPLLVVLAFAGVGAARSARRRSAERKEAPATKVQEALDEARAADAAGDTHAVAAGAERAVHAAILASTGVRSRGARQGELASELEAAGLEGPLAARCAELLRDAESMRFDPTADAAGRSALVARARSLAKELASAERAAE